VPSLQRGEVKRLPGGSWAYRYYDADGRRRQRGRFQTRSEAVEALGNALDVARLGADVVARRRGITFGELVDEYPDCRIELSEEERHLDAHRDLFRVGRVVVERAPAGRVRNRWVYDSADDAECAFLRHKAPA
jgi:hypothetical protein